MKKLMIAATVAMLGIAANAAKCNWAVEFAFSGEESMDNPSYANVDSAGYYWIVALAGNDTTGLGVDAKGDLVLGEGMSLYGTKTAFSDGAAQGQITGLSAANNGSYYAIVMLDTAYGNASGVSDAAMITGIVDAGEGVQPKDATPITFSNMFAQAGEYDTYAVQMSAVPEPTSGLLLLLGVAGLALRRRRA